MIEMKSGKQVILNNEMYESALIANILQSLILYPCVFGVIEQDLADYLEDAGLFSLETYTVTELGLAVATQRAA